MKSLIVISISTISETLIFPYCSPPEKHIQIQYVIHSSWQPRETVLPRTAQQQRPVWSHIQCY